MTLCPIAIIVGCKKCPAFSVCPLKTVIGDYMKQEKEQTKQQADNEEKQPTESVQVHRNVLQYRSSPPDARLQIPQPIRSRSRPGYCGVNIRPAGVRKSWAIAAQSERCLHPMFQL